MIISTQSDHIQLYEMKLNLDIVWPVHLLSIHIYSLSIMFGWNAIHINALRFHAYLALALQSL